MKKTTLLTFFAFLFSTGIYAQRHKPSYRPPSPQVPYREFRNDFDLKTAAAVFGQSRTLDDFEEKLNDSKLMLSNLDFNYDGKTDYLRVMEIKEQIDRDYSMHLLIIQAVITRNETQDIATIEIEGNGTFDYDVQFVGHPFIYGMNYIIEPTYKFTPRLIGAMFWRSYEAYSSPVSWEKYPLRYKSRQTVDVLTYKSNASMVFNSHKGAFDRYQRVNIRKSRRAAILYKDIARSDYEKKYPNHIYKTR